MKSQGDTLREVPTVYVEVMKLCSHQWQKRVACEELNLHKLNIREQKTLLRIQCKLVNGLYSDS
jgi:hypothetical protein